ncbi:ATP-dependent DNA helicase RecG [Clostridiales bacterium]|nr:ATP-dependent DNA helicase RecG [Clostridiales bacterium]
MLEYSRGVGCLKGIGSGREKYLKKLNIETIGDLICHYPRDYEDRSRITEINDLVPDELSVILAEIKDEAKNTFFKGMNITKARAFDESGSISLVWYNQPYVRNNIKEGNKYAFIGRLTLTKNGHREFRSPEIEKTDENGCWNGGITPIYPLCAGLSQKVFRRTVAAALEEAEGNDTEFIPFDIRKEFKLCSREFALKNIHMPESVECFHMARKRLVFEELFLLETALLRIKSETVADKKGIKMACADMESFFSNMPFTFTKAQNRVFNEILADMTDGRVMNRLIQGDVGSGKTAVAMAAAYMAVKNGFQAAMMAPTEVLAAQHYYGFKSIFEPLGINVMLMTGGLKAKEKREALQKVAEGEADIVIGTHAIIQKKVLFKNIGIVITDEQHRFGVRQRQELSEKGDNPHVLVMTATPIPRTLALILYGDLDISIIDSLPPGRQSIDTFAVNTGYRQRIYNFIDKEIEKGRQAYIICAMVEENEKVEAEAALNYSKNIRNSVLGRRKIEVIHGKMKSEEKDSILKAFADGVTDILIATTVIEVGINVPNATVMVIENAERFGLAQLHQLRGRVGRGNEKSYCILVSDNKSEITRQRLKTMTATTDGFKISEMDLRLRGPGEFFGTRQHGLPNLKIANLYRDMDILKEAQRASQYLIKDDSKLIKMENMVLRNELDRLLGKATIRM